MQDIAPWTLDKFSEYQVCQILDHSDQSTTRCNALWTTSAAHLHPTNPTTQPPTYPTTKLQNYDHNRCY